MTRPNLSSERGVAMIVVLMALIAGTMLATVTLAAAGADMPFARESQDRKQAYAAAESGLEYYLFQLGQDTDYWTRCTSNPGPGGGEKNPVNLEFKRSNPTQDDTRNWRKVPGTTAEYAIELVSPPGQQPCEVNKAETTLLDQASGTFRIRATGRQNGVTRSIISTLRRRSFLDFIYFTHLETADPQTYGSPQARQAAAENCVVPRDAREGKGCTEIQFSGEDEIRGPFHTNDDILTCGSTTFGRKDKNDRIEISGPNGWQNASGCSGKPDFVGTLVKPAPDPLELPTSNSALEHIAEPAYRFTGETTIQLNGASMTVTTGGSPTPRTLPLPPNGVIYVNQVSCSGSETPLLQRYDDDTNCGNLYVSGTYSKSLTLAAANDVIVTEDLKKSGDVVLGLIANNFVRVYHPVTRSNPSDDNTCTNNPQAEAALYNITIEAAILSLAHSFIVDNYRCGKKLGTLTVTGAIAQKFRGPVGTTAPTGYTKHYEYDDRLKYRSPPFFLDPVSAAWKVLRSNEQVPATR